MKISIVGMGMGRFATMTGEAAEAVRAADAVIGAARLIEALPADIKAARHTAVAPEQIAGLIGENEKPAPSACS